MMKFKVHTSLCFSEGNQLGGNTLVGHMLLMNKEPEVVTEKYGQVWAILVPYDDPGELLKWILTQLWNHHRAPSNALTFISTVLWHHRETPHTCGGELWVRLKKGHLLGYTFRSQPSSVMADALAILSGQQLLQSKLVLSQDCHSQN